MSELEKELFLMKTVLINQFNNPYASKLVFEANQFVVYNPSAVLTIYLSFRYNNVGQTRYEFIVNPNRMFVSPIVNFNEIFYNAVGIVTDTDHIRPQLFIYEHGNFNPYLVTLP